MAKRNSTPPFIRIKPRDTYTNSSANSLACGRREGHTRAGEVFRRGNVWVRGRACGFGWIDTTEGRDEKERGRGRRREGVRGSGRRGETRGGKINENKLSENDYRKYNRSLKIKKEENQYHHNEPSSKLRNEETPLTYRGAAAHLSASQPARPPARMSALAFTSAMKLSAY